MKSAISTLSWLRRAASSAASLQRLARSAPTIPGVVAASASRSTSSAERQRPRVDLEDLAAAVLVRRLHGDAPVEASRAQQRGVEDLGAVGGADHDDRLGGLEAVHLGQDLVERLLALVVRAGDAGRPLPGAADGVELVDEDDRRRRLLGLGEQVAHARGADADDRLDELRRRDREEGRVSLAGHRTREQRLAGAGRPVEQHAVGDSRAEAHVPIGRLQEVDDLGELGLGLVDSGHVVERDPDLRRVDAPRLRAAEVPEPAEPTAGSGGAAARGTRTGRRAAASARNRAGARQISDVPGFGFWALT